MENLRIDENSSLYLSIVRSIGVYISKMGKKYKSSLQKIMYNHLRFDENNGKSQVTLDKYGKK
jgi:hypothetical protein